MVLIRGKKHLGNQVRPYLYFGFVLTLTPEGYMVAVLKEYTSNTTETKHLVDCRYCEPKKCPIKCVTRMKRKRKAQQRKDRSKKGKVKGTLKGGQIASPEVLTGEQ